MNKDGLGSKTSSAKCIQNLILLPNSSERILNGVHLIFQRNLTQPKCRIDIKTLSWTVKCRKPAHLKYILSWQLH